MMSTPVIVATEQAGVAHIFHRNGTGALTQTGQLLVGPVQPAALAALAADLNEHLNWTRVIRARAQPEPVAELPAPKRTRRKAVTHRSKEEIAAYREEVIRYVRLHPGTTTPEVAAGLHGELTKATANMAFQALDWHRKRKALRSERAHASAPSRWYA